MATTKTESTNSSITESKQQALLNAAVALATTPSFDADDISYRVQRLKETLDGIVFAD